MKADDYAERLARGEPRAVLHAYGHPGAYERVTHQRNAAVLHVAALNIDVARLEEMLRRGDGTAHCDDLDVHDPADCAICPYWLDEEGVCEVTGAPRPDTREGR